MDDFHCEKRLAQSVSAKIHRGVRALAQNLEQVVLLFKVIFVLPNDDGNASSPTFLFGLYFLEKVDFAGPQIIQKVFRRARLFFDETRQFLCISG